jgi:hypothetical protein
VVRAILEADAFEDRERRRQRLRARQAPELERHRDVVARREFLQQVMKLVN